MPRILSILAAGTLCGALLASPGCVTLGPFEATAGDGFHARGRIAVRDGADGFAASFDWRQQGERYRIDLWGPLGQGRLRIAGDADALTATDARGAIVDGDALGQRFGWSVPLGAIRHWLRGRCEPALSPCERHHHQGAGLAGFEQHGWRVRLSDWRPGPDAPLPGRIVATQGQRRIAVAVREWR